MKITTKILNGVIINIVNFHRSLLSKALALFQLLALISNLILLRCVGYDCISRLHHNNTVNHVYNPVLSF